MFEKNNIVQGKSLKEYRDIGQDRLLEGLQVEINVNIYIIYI